MNPGRFAQGVLIDLPEGTNLANTGRKVKWVAVRGNVPDWAVYAQNPHYGEMAWSFNRIEHYGDKVFASNAKKLVSCDDEALAAYRS